jgi:hypothetical protein
MDNLITALFVVALVFAWVFWICGSLVRTDAIVRQWAEQMGYRIVFQDARHNFVGPFLFRLTPGQQVFRVTVEDRSGNRKSGWIRCGAPFLGVLLSDQVDEVWDER